MACADCRLVGSRRSGHLDSCLLATAARPPQQPLPGSEEVCWVPGHDSAQLPQRLQPARWPETSSLTRQAAGELSVAHAHPSCPQQVRGHPAAPLWTHPRPRPRPSCAAAFPGGRAGRAPLAKGPAPASLGSPCRGRHTPGPWGSFLPPEELTGMATTLRQLSHDGQERRADASCPWE